MMKLCRNPRCRAIIADDKTYCRDCEVFINWRETTRGVKR